MLVGWEWYRALDERRKHSLSNKMRERLRQFGKWSNLPSGLHHMDSCCIYGWKMAFCPCQKLWVHHLLEAGEAGKEEEKANRQLLGRCWNTSCFLAGRTRVPAEEGAASLGTSMATDLYCTEREVRGLRAHWDSFSSTSQHPEKCNFKW